MRKPYGKKTDLEDLKDTCWEIAMIINKARTTWGAGGPINCRAEVNDLDLEEFGTREDWEREYLRLHRKANRYNLDLSKIWSN